ncbi:MAG: polysaccharide deacetylase family protein [Bacteroidota bacterium]
MKILLFSPALTHRIQYISQFLFERLMGLEVTLTSAKSTFLTFAGPRINYSTAHFEASCFYIEAHSILGESDVKQQHIEVRHDLEYPYFFASSTDESHFPFDLLAFSFYLLSRYEEYLPFQPDQHDRFSAQQSLAYQEGFLRLPIIDLWAKRLRAQLQQKFPYLVFKTPEYTYLPTYDIDHAWAYLNKGIWRTLGAAGADLLHGRLPSFFFRWTTQLGLSPDPYQRFDFLNELHQSREVQPIYFFLLGDYGPYDKNIDPQKPAFQQLIRQLAEQYSVGIHPSYQSNEEVKRVRSEQNRLEAITGQSVRLSRQHFLRLRLPKTYRELIRIGIEVDYSMGYAAEIGFRAGTAMDFLWFDLLANELTPLKLIPFQVMDVSLKNYLGLSPEEAMRKVEPLIEHCRAVGGCFCSLWHNSSFAPMDGWTEEWMAFYQQLFDCASREG